MVHGPAQTESPWALADAELDTEDTDAPVSPAHEPS